MQRTLADGTEVLRVLKLDQDRVRVRLRRVGEEHANWQTMSSAAYLALGPRLVEKGEKKWTTVSGKNASGAKP